MSRPLEKLLEHDIETLNNHLPDSRVTLKELIEHPTPSFITRSGETSVFRREEIDNLIRLVPDQFQEEIRLPIVILRRMDYGSGIHTVAGNKAELFLVHIVLGYVDPEWDYFVRWKPQERLARPQVQLLRRKLPSTTVLGIVIGVTKEKRAEPE